MRRLPSIKLAASANALLTDNPEGLSIEDSYWFRSIRKSYEESKESESDEESEESEESESDDKSMAFDNYYSILM